MARERAVCAGAHCQTRACAGPGRARAMSSLCRISSSSSFFILSSIAPPRLSSWRATRQGEGASRVSAQRHTDATCTAHSIWCTYAVHGIVQRCRRRRVLGLAEQAPHCEGETSQAVCTSHVRTPSCGRQAPQLLKTLRAANNDAAEVGVPADVTGERRRGPVVCTLRRAPREPMCRGRTCG